MQINLQYYVICWSENNKEPVLWNIFNSSYVYEQAIRLIKQKRKGRITFDEYIAYLDKVFQFQFWSRYEYEYSISEPFTDDHSKYYKRDVYYQLKNNVRTIGYDILRQYREQIKRTGD